MSLKDLYLSPTGRIGRRVFWLQGILVLLVISAIGGVLDSLLNAGGILSTIIWLVGLDFPHSCHWSDLGYC
jgi:uncharacterized membrane protein YhaH (DUF805 family)